ncbi:MAG: metal-dependent hydrolase [Thermodesulfobacteriota bacterium]
MPGYKTHFTVGGLVGGGAVALSIVNGWYIPAPQTALLLIAVAAGAAIFPDVDTDSKGQRLYYSLLVLVDAVLIFKEEYRWAALLGLCAMLPAVDQHRGWTHTWWAMFVVPLPLLLLPSLMWSPQVVPVMIPYYIAAIVGYLTHLALDRRW